MSPDCSTSVQASRQTKCGVPTYLTRTCTCGGFGLRRTILLFYGHGPVHENGKQVLHGQRRVRYQEYCCPCLPQLFNGTTSASRLPLSASTCSVLCSGTFVFALCCIPIQSESVGERALCLDQRHGAQRTPQHNRPLCLCMITVASYFYLVKQSRWSSAVFLSLAALSKKPRLLSRGIPAL